MQRLASAVGRALGEQSRLARALRPAYERLLDLSSGGRGVRRTVNGRETFYIDPRSRGLFPEAYEPEVFAYLRERVQPGSVCLNIGANAGLYTLCLAQWTGPQGKVFAFEPNPAARRLLASNIARNQCGRQIEVVAEAVSSSVGESDFFASGAEGYSRLGSPNPDSPAKARKLRIATTTIDAFCSARSIAPDWIVMDVEGYEGAALEGARSVIASATHPLVLVVEMHPHLWRSAGWSQQRMMALFDELRLDPVPITGQDSPFAMPGAVSCTARQCRE
jgi:FkbM family methyltransferase